MDKTTYNRIVNEVTNNQPETLKLHQLMSDGEWQNAVDRFVNNEVFYCASYLISELSTNDKYMEDILEFSSVPDYESSVNDYLDNQADYQEKADFLEYMNIDVPTLQLTIGVNEDGTKWNYQTGDNSYTGGAYGLPYWLVTEVFHNSSDEDIQEDIASQHDSVFPDSDEFLLDIECASEIDNFIENNIDNWRETVESLIDQEISDWQTDDNSDYQDAVDYLRLDPEYIDAYEHWIISDWLAGELSEKGQMTTNDFLGLTIWGRTTTGQSISMDYVINQIYFDLVNEVNNY